MENKKSFILYYDWYENIRELSQDQKWNLLDAIFQFHNWGVTVEMWGMEKMAFNFIKWSFERDKEKYASVCERNKNNIGKRWNTKNTTGKTGKKKNTKNTDNDNDNDSDSDTNIESSTLIINDENSEKPNLPVPTEFWDPEINAVIKSIKEFCMQHKIIYDSTDDRMYGKHIAKAKEFWALAETMGKSRVELALFIIQIAEQDKFWRGKVCWPAAIYNFRAKILNNWRATYQNQVQNPDVLVI